MKRNSQVLGITKEILFNTKLGKENEIRTYTYQNLEVSFELVCDFLPKNKTFNGAYFPLYPAQFDARIMRPLKSFPRTSDQFQSSIELWTN